MNILTSFASKTLTKNKTRTAVTIIGIILSVSMFTAVIEAIVSGQQFLINHIRENKGSYHAYVSELDPQSASAFSKEKEIKECTYLDNIGYAHIGSQNTYKPYLYVASMSDGFEDMVAINLKSGRLPKTSSEIILPYHLFENGGVSFKIGDTLELDVGKRTFEGFYLFQSSAFEEGETLTETEPQAYTVVGFYERFDFDIEAYSSPGYTAITTGRKGETADVFCKFSFVYDARKYIDRLFEIYPSITSNSDLLKMYGVFGSSAITGMVGGFAAILIGLIMFGSVALIYNSFSISVSERTKQFGMLRSVGATKKQLRATVIKEALMLCLVGVPLGLFFGCLGIGITFFFISDKFSLLMTKLYSGGGASDIPMSLHISPAALLLTAAIGVVTVVIAAYIPALRAVKITPLEAVRQQSDIKIHRRRIKKYSLTRKLFGFEAMLAAKNFARNKKRYRAAVMSMFMSIVLFISASSFCDYLTTAVRTVSRDVGYDIRLYTSILPSEAEFLTSIDSAKKSAYCGGYSQDVYIDDSLLSDAYLGSYTGNFVHNVTVIYVDDNNYAELVKQNGLLQNGGAVILNHYRHYDRNGKVTLVPVIDRKKIDGKITLSVPKTVDGYYYSDFDGENFRYYQHMTEGVTEQGRLTLDFDSALVKTTLPVSGFIDSAPYYAESSGLVAIYPISQMRSGEYVSSAYFITDDYAACEKELESLLTEKSIGYSIFNNAADNASNRAITTVINVFAYGFIILISLISIANVFNTVTTNIHLRRRELAMIKSVGITRRGFYRMMNYECVICGLRSLILGLPTAAAVTFLIYLAANSGFGTSFYIPLYSVLIAVLSVFVVIFAAMLYSMHRLSGENIIETLRNENI